MKTNGTFNLKKEFKRMLASYTDKHRRAEVKKIFIEGQHFNEVMARTRGKPKKESAE